MSRSERNPERANTVRALVLEAPRELNVRTFPRPSIAADDALLRVEACGLCGTDHEMWSGEMRKFLPLVPGHEAVGIIEEIGPRAADRWGVAVGDRVGVAPRQACGECATCRSGDPRGCERHRGDTYGSISVHTAPFLWGGYGEYQYLSPDSQIVRIPAHLDPVVAAMFNAVANGIRWGSRRAPDQAGRRRGGARSRHPWLSAAVAGARRGRQVRDVDRPGRARRARLDLARRFGIDLVVDVAGRRSRRGVDGASRLARDVVVDVTAMAPAAFVQALDLARDRGTVCVAGIHATPRYRAFDRT
jgi:alcohol dehydrogenase